MNRDRRCKYRLNTANTLLSLLPPPLLSFQRYSKKSEKFSTRSEFQKLKTFHSARNLHFYFSKRLLFFGKSKNACSPAIRRSRKVIKLLLVAWNRIYHRTRKKNRVSRRKGSSMNVSGQCHEWLTRARRARERKKRDIKGEEE